MLEAPEIPHDEEIAQELLAEISPEEMKQLQERIDACKQLVAQYDAVSPELVDSSYKDIAHNLFGLARNDFKVFQRDGWKSQIERVEKNLSLLEIYFKKMENPEIARKELGDKREGFVELRKEADDQVRGGKMGAFRYYIEQL